MALLKVSLFLMILCGFARITWVDGACTTVNPSDVVFVVDSSGSICDSDPGYQYLRDKTCNNWKSIVNFVAGIVSGLTIGPSSVMVGLVIFQTNARVAWTLDRYQDKASLLQAINSLAYIGGDTATTAALRLTRTQVFSLTGDRPNAANIAVVITDGNPTIEPEGLNDEVYRCQAAGITMVAVGITNQINENVLRSISSPPQQLNVNYFISPDYTSISSISRRLEIYTFCPSEAPQVWDSTPTTTTTTTTTINPCSSTTSYFDITFVVDASGSICDTNPGFVFGRDSTCGNWQSIIDFMKSLALDLDIGPTRNKIAVVIFYSYAYVAWNLDRYLDKNSIISAIDQLRYDPGGDTATTDGLLKMRTEVFGQAGDRPDYSNMAIIITDGRPTIRVNDLQAEIDRVQAAGIAMVAIGITNSIDENTLKKLSSPPQLINENYFTSPDFNSIALLKSRMQSFILCPSTTPAGAVIQSVTQPCVTTKAIADVTFLVDASGSICDTDPNYRFGRDSTCNNWQLILNFLKNVVSALNIGPNGNKVAVVIFRSTAYLAWNLNSYLDTNSLLNAIDQLRYDPGGDTATTDGLEVMRTQVYGQIGDRPDVINIAITITDGRPTIRPQDLQSAIDAALAAGIKMVAIGVTNSIDENTLQRLSSAPHQRDVNYFMTPDYNSINNILRNLQDQVLCPNIYTPTYAPTFYQTTTTLTSACRDGYRADVVFLLDSSGSICDPDPNYRYGVDTSCVNWQSLINFVYQLVSVMKIGPENARVAVVTFHNYATVLWTLDTYKDSYSLLNAIRNIRYVGGSTATTEGFMRARTQVFSQPGDRPDASNVIVVITDGKPTENVEGLNSEVGQVQAAGIKVVAVGITNSIDENTLRLISSPPHQFNSDYFTSVDYQSITTITSTLEKATFCPNQ